MRATGLRKSARGRTRRTRCKPNPVRDAPGGAAGRLRRAPIMSRSSAFRATPHLSRHPDNVRLGVERNGPLHRRTHVRAHAGGRRKLTRLDRMRRRRRRPELNYRAYWAVVTPVRPSGVNPALGGRIGAQSRRLSASTECLAFRERTSDARGQQADQAAVWIEARLVEPSSRAAARGLGRDTVLSSRTGSTRLAPVRGRLPRSSNGEEPIAPSGKRSRFASAGASERKAAAAAGACRSLPPPAATTPAPT